MSEDPKVEDPKDEDPEYDKHGGFPLFTPAQPGPGFGPFVASMRRLQDRVRRSRQRHLGRSGRPRRRTRRLLEPFEAPEGVGPAGRMPTLPGAGNLLMPPFKVRKFEADGVELEVQFSRFHVGGNYAVHGGVLPLLFDSVFGTLIHAAGQPLGRTRHPISQQFRRGLRAYGLAGGSMTA